MTQATHTPGPWKYDPKTGLVAHDEYDEIGFSAVATIHQPYEATPERQANARLIAALPDLLEALESIVDDTWSNTAEMRKLARAAIAKATASY